ncbi:hypothetical protein [Pseudomonas sp. MUP55]|uniref:hypothetical protein n=1 Tax=Pseudomonas sp. MUP55 TaxID=3087234 RepID=UPI002A59F161|nr:MULTISPECIES: hypothetical protein [unclassified Pseudomonas]WPN92914.1 hypothetical protein SC319_00595 [Pseudomonas sp. MUP56]WPN98440.1 hypothetical protein SC318_00595 [Pseudomonas sp. MUP55]
MTLYAVPIAERMPGFLQNKTSLNQRVINVALLQGTASCTMPDPGPCEMHDGQSSGQGIDGGSAVAEAGRRHENATSAALLQGDVGRCADSCTTLPFIEQNEPCNLPDYSGTNHQHS